MTLTEYWEAFEKIRQLNDIAMIFGAVGFFILLIGIAHCLITRKYRIGRIAIITFYIIEILMITTWGVNHYRFSQLYDKWKSTNESINFSYVDNE